MPTYTIEQGVRRAKAASLLGHEFIDAIIINEKCLEVGRARIAIADLRSPHRSEIDLRGEFDRERFLRIVRGFRAGDSIRPITVRLGTTGILLTSSPA